ncbi:MAG: iron-sulfur cluster assembly scaffold protein [Rhodovulum sulfidophilum]|uniref:Iron-sulfur cluster assembly scaffold protein n=1 Tax=Rhodovulum sulfidophilum TaxID=35806 RepID=A0A2W5N6E8_RHOSU|nr:MAG: iron-sulfur cluster assembly scaffold protein [Rhodovulum sulfidophilum]
MAEQDLIKLYSQRILALATDIPHRERLPAPAHTARKRAPLCGSTVTVDVGLDAAGRITAFGQDVRACALGQASAALLGQHVIGVDRAAIQRLRDQLRAMLRENGPVPEAPFEGYEVLIPARDYRNRHDSILLAIEATLDAIDEAARAA